MSLLKLTVDTTTSLFEQDASRDSLTTEFLANRSLFSALSNTLDDPLAASFASFAAAGVSLGRVMKPKIPFTYTQTGPHRDG